MRFEQQSPRYEVLGRVAEGRTSAIYLARMIPPNGAPRLVAAKRLHREFTFDKACVAMLSEEARLCGLIRHPNVVGALDLALIDGALSAVLEHVEGETLGVLVERSWDMGQAVPLPFAVGIVHDVLHGLQAAHEARGSDGAPSPIVHRDVSLQTIFVGVDGKARLTDFGVATATDGLDAPYPSEQWGPTGYMPPEQVRGEAVTPRVDVYAAAVVLWELLAGRPLRDQAGALAMTEPELPSTFNPDIPPELDDVILRALSSDARERFPTAAQFALALDRWRTGSAHAIGEWVQWLAADQIAATRNLQTQPATAGQKSWLESGASDAAVARNVGPPSSGLPAERTMVMPLTSTPPVAAAPPVVAAPTAAPTLVDAFRTQDWARVKEALPFKPSLIAAVAVPVLLACILAVLMRPQERAMDDAALGAPVEPALQPTQAVPPPEPPPEVMPPPQAAATIIVTPMASTPPARSAPTSTASPRPAPLRPAAPAVRKPAAPPPTAAPAPPPAPTVDDSRGSR